MTTKATNGKLHTIPNERQFFRLGLAALVTLVIALGLLVGAFNGAKIFGVHANGTNDAWRRIAPALAQTQTATPTPTFLGRSDSPPLQYDPSSQNTSQPTATPDQVYIGFDRFPSGALVPPGTAITNQYPPAIFSSDSNHYPIADNQYWGTSFPNDLGRTPYGYYDGTGYAPLFVDFTTPVNNLRFYIDAVDEFRKGIAQINIFQNNRLAATRNIDGNGRVFQPIPVDVGGWGFNNVTRIEIVNINDYLGIGFDDFSFTLAPTPSPTPTPQPTPVTPTSLTATVTDRQVQLYWTGSTGATGYYVKRGTTSGGPYTTIAAPDNPSYLDLSPNGETTYFYVVSAFNNAGESPKSNQVSVSIPSACGDQAAVTQSPGHIHSISGWDMTVEITANDGVVVRDVSLNGRYMAKSISIPYFTVATSKTQGVVRGELKPGSNDSTLRSRLVKLETDGGTLDANFTGGGISIDAEYIVDRISPTSDSCLHVSQHYYFFGKNLTKTFGGGHSCEPSGTTPCEMFNPFVSYKFESRNDEVLLSFNAVQRNQFWINALPLNGVGLFRDCESILSNCRIEVNLDTGQTSAFRNKLNPLTTELRDRVIERGQDTGKWDNIHQTFNSYVFHEPGGGPPLDSSKRLWFISGGCPECVHMHWRWGKSVELPGDDWGHGSLNLYYPNTNQDMDIAIIKYKSVEQENAEPMDYGSLVNGESIRSGADVGDQVLVYYSATGHRQEDL